MTNRNHKLSLARQADLLGIRPGTHKWLAALEDC